MKKILSIILSILCFIMAIAVGVMCIVSYLTDINWFYDMALMLCFVNTTFMFSLFGVLISPERIK